MKKIMVINGVNLNMLGVREPSIYGNNTYEDLLRYIKQETAHLDIEVEFFQSNIEGEVVNAIHRCYFEHFDGIVINPGAWTHYSYAIFDALKSVSINTVEVHISDINSRESFRHVSVIEPACVKQIKGKGFSGYVEAIKSLI